MRILIIALLTILSAIPVLTQEKSKGNTQPRKSSDAETAKKEKARKDADAAEEASLLRQRGISLLRQAGDDAATIAVNLDDGLTACRLVIKAADLLWDGDQVAARKFFESAFDIAIKYHRENKASNRNDERMNVINAVSRHDSALSRKFMDQLLEEKQREQKDALPKDSATVS